MNFIKIINKLLIYIDIYENYLYQKNIYQYLNNQINIKYLKY